MSKRKKTILGVFLSLTLTLFLILTFVYPWRERSDVYLKDFSLSEDGSQITLDVTGSGGNGYINGIDVKQGGDNKYITFRSTWLNNSLSAKSKFVIDLNKSCGKIYFYTGGEGYRVVLEKDMNTQEWLKVQDYNS